MIDAESAIQAIYRPVKPETHNREILQALGERIAVFEFDAFYTDRRQSPKNVKL
ncbi:hypothetical protein [Planktothrix mougeotii]|uniref:Transposase n=1 Tax=Planktothrix mougeotii LEGE 06226 TaxID=1828728 RepID=A0ABR9U679_9CYAN|nr:hypothetical protein [Planktothrix mougeotii]MBE9141671.1 hypothetical protein [Planktothrix mougeotii LEGE 06226]